MCRLDSRTAHRVRRTAPRAIARRVSASKMPSAFRRPALQLTPCRSCWRPLRCRCCRCPYTLPPLHASDQDSSHAARCLHLSRICTSQCALLTASGSAMHKCSRPCSHITACHSVGKCIPHNAVQADSVICSCAKDRGLLNCKSTVREGEKCDGAPRNHSGAMSRMLCETFA